MVERQLNLTLQALAVQTTAFGPGRHPRVGVTPEAYRQDDLRTQRLMAGTAWVGQLPELVQDRLGPGHQQLADVDRALLVRHAAPPSLGVASHHLPIAEGGYRLHRSRHAVPRRPVKDRPCYRLRP